MSLSLQLPRLSRFRSRLWPARGIQFRLIALFFLAAALPLALMGVVLFSTSRSALREAAFRDALNNAKLASRLIDQYVGDARAALVEAARRPDLVEAFQRQQVIPRVAIYRNLHESLWKFETLWDLDRQGTASVSYPADSGITGMSFSDRAYFRETMRAGAPYVSDLSPSASQDPVSLTVAAPISGPDSQPLGVLAGQLRLTEITALLSTIDMGAGGYFYVVDRRARVISHPRAEQLFQPIRHDNQLVRRALAGQSGVEERVNRWGVHMLTAYAPIPGLGWAIMAQIPAAVAYAPMQARSQELLLWVGGAIGLALLLGIVSSRIVARPLREVHEGVFKLARGEFHHQLPVRRRDEIGQLAEQFNAMAAALRNSYATLEAQVAERTRHLSAVYGIATTVSETLDLQEVLDRSLGRALEAMDAQGGYVCLYHEAGTCFRLAAHRGVTQEFVQAMQEIPMAETGAWEAPRAGALLMAEAQGGLLHPRERLTAQMGYQASLEVPLKSRHRFVGVMGLLFGEARRFPQTETALVMAIGQQVGMAIEQAQLHQAVRETSTALASRNEELTTLVAIARDIAVALEPHEFLHRLVEQAAHLLKGQASAIWLADEASGLIRVAESYQMSPDIQSELAIRVGEHIVGRVVATATPIALPDALWDPRVAHRSRLLQDGLRAMIHVPLRDGHRAIGSLSVYFRDVHDFQLHELELLAALGDHAVTGLRNCRLFEAMKQEAITDGLTGLYNHRYFQQRMDEELRRAQLERQTVSLLFCDLDHFKLFNDLHGHEAGDQALQQVAGLIRKLIRAVDLPARYGGEEFAIILPETGDREALLVAERLRREVAGLGFLVRSSALATLTISIGIASFPQDAQDRQALLDKADWAMYCAKRKGRNQVRRFSVEQESYSLGGPPPLPLRDVNLPVVHALAAAVDARDSSTARHSEEVAQLATALARHMGLPEEEVRRVTLAARLHDVGKIGIPDAVLHKPGPLGREERQLLRTHPVIARSIMAQVPELEEVIPLVYHQQERYGGGGHPEGLRGQAIPRGARIIAVANAYQAMISTRPYRTARTEREALEALGLERGSRFDPEVVDALVALVDGESDGRRFSEAAPTPSPADPARS